MSIRGIKVAALVLWPVGAAQAQRHAHLSAPVAPDSAAARFIVEARAGTARYRDQSIAISDGYRQVGPDLPAMGEHWLNVRLILADTVDAAHPPVLIYVSSANGPVLAGAAYTRLLGAEDSYPDFPRGLHRWHDHSGFIEDEALPTSHVRHDAGSGSPVTRLGILHLWMWEENPDGAWTAENWTLPFVRAGLRPAVHNDAAARVLALAADSGRYYLNVLTATTQLDSGEVRQVRALLATAAAGVRSMRLTVGTQLTSADQERLDMIWKQLWREIRGRLTPDVAAHLEQLRRLWW